MPKFETTIVAASHRSDILEGILRDDIAVFGGRCDNSFVAAHTSWQIVVLLSVSFLHRLS